METTKKRRAYLRARPLASTGFIRHFWVRWYRASQMRRWTCDRIRSRRRPRSSRAINIRALTIILFIRRLIIRACTTRNPGSLFLAIPRILVPRRLGTHIVRVIIPIPGVVPVLRLLWRRWWRLLRGGTMYEMWMWVTRCCRVQVRLRRTHRHLPRLRRRDHAPRCIGMQWRVHLKRV